MSQQSVERALGKMVTDEAFRNDFFTDPERVSLKTGLDLLPDEMEALRRVPRRMLDRLGARLDGRICRLPVPRCGPSTGRTPTERTPTERTPTELTQ